MKIFIVEDDMLIARELTGFLRSWSYEVSLVKNFDRIIDEFQDFQPQLVLMDVTLPVHNGFYWCREIRKISEVPILFISARTENMDIVMAMQYGGDDYITKPMDLSVLLAKIQAILRRAYSFQVQDSCQELKGLRLSRGEMTLTYGDEVAGLTKTELLIIEELFRQPGVYVTRQKLMELCWAGDDFIDDNTLAVNVSRIRGKLKDLGLNEVILTKKGVGYCLNEDFLESR